MAENQTMALREDILDILRNSDEFVRTFKSQIEGKNVIMFVGNAKSGKSTLVNYVTGQPLVAFRNGDYFKIELQEPSRNVAIIDHGSLSHTTVPNVIEMQGQPDTLIVDAPGFDDNRGLLQEIRNALYINQIKYAKGVRFVLVVDSNNIVADNINYFLSLIETVEAILSDSTKLQEAVSVVFTKDWREYAKSEMTDLLKTKILDVHGMHGRKDLVRHLVERDDLIGLFKMPTVVGPLTEDDVDDNVRNAIFDVAPINLTESDVKFGLSKSASVFLLKTYMGFHDIVIKLQSVFDGFASLTLKMFACLKTDMLFNLTEEQLVGNPNNVVSILKRFCSFVKYSKEIVVATNQIPSVSRDLYVDGLNSACRELTKIGVEVPDVRRPETLDLEDVRIKLDDISCIEKIVEKNNKSINVRTCFENSLKYLKSELSDLSSHILEEIECRKYVCKKVVDVPKTNIKGRLRQIDESYLNASSLNEAAKMDVHLQNYLKLLDGVLEEIKKRPAIMKNFSKEFEELSGIRSDVSDKKDEIVKFVECKNKNVFNKYMPTFNFSSLRNRYQQNHLFKANLLDNCCDIFSDRD